MSVVIEKIVTEKFEMKYFKFGSGNRTAVILPGLSVKSVMDSADSVVSAYKPMHKDYTVFVFDRRSVCPENYTISDMAEDTAEALMLLGLNNIYLFGVSQGGMLAQLIALNHSELVYKLALCSTVARITEDNSGILREWTALAEQKDEEVLYKRMIESLFSAEFVDKFGKYIVQLMSGAGDEDLKRFVILAKACDGFDVYSGEGKIKCPALVIGSKADAVFEFKYIAEVAEKLGARMKVYDGYGHALYDETPECLNEILKFYNE